ncbi:MAG: bifunctional nuclease family protein, partial [Acidimicrobiales bacterium]
PRPLTHELFSDVLTRLGATLDAVRLVGRRAGVVMAEIEMTSPRGHEKLSCRPTDAVTLAIRQPVAAPILVDRRLFSAVGDVEPED